MYVCMIAVLCNMHLIISVSFNSQFLFLQYSVLLFQFIFQFLFPVFGLDSKLLQLQLIQISLVCTYKFICITYNNSNSADNF